MMHQPNVTIKYEPSSPSTGTPAAMGSMAATRAMSGSDTVNSEGEEMQASTPDTRRRLQNVVLHRRKAKGLTGIPNNLFEKPKASSLTQVDLDKRERRKEQNRKAATKCRAKKKELECKAKQETTKYAESNKNMQLLLVAMYQQLYALMTCLNEHLSCSDCRISAQEQEGHRRLVYETEKLMQSCPKLCTPEEQQRQQSNLSAENTGEDDTSQVSTISHDNYSSNSEMSCSTPTNDLMVTNGLDANVSYLAEPENLKSWDLQNINPDIPNTLTLDIEYSLFTATSDTKSVYEPIQGISHNYSSQASFQPFMTNAVSTKAPAPTIELTCLGNNTTGVFHEPGDGSDLSLSRTTDRSHSVLMYTEDRDILNNVVSPNLVQPSEQPMGCCQNQQLQSTIHSGIGSCNEEVSNRRLIGQQYQVNADINNHGSRQINPTVLRGENYSVYGHHPYGCNLQVNYSNKSPSISPKIFTFGDDHSDPKNMEDSGTEPISPFYTQGGSRRM